MYGIVLENLGHEPEDFQNSVWDAAGVTSTMLLDQSRAFFPRKNSGLIELLRPRTLMHTFETIMYGDRSIGGNQKGEFRYNGGVIVLGKGDSGVLYEYIEENLGDKADIAAVQLAVKQITDT